MAQPNESAFSQDGMALRHALVTFAAGAVFMCILFAVISPDDSDESLLKRASWVVLSPAALAHSIRSIKSAWITAAGLKAGAFIWACFGIQVILPHGSNIFPIAAAFMTAMTFAPVIVGCSIGAPREADAPPFLTW